MVIEKISPIISVQKQLVYDDETDLKNLLSLPMFTKDEHEIKMYLLSIFEECELEQSCEKLETTIINKLY